MVAVLSLTVLCLLLAVVCPASWQPWVQLVAAIAVGAVVTVRRSGSPLLARRRPPRSADVDVVDLVAPDLSLVGCVDGDRIVTTAIEISGGAFVATEVGADGPDAFRGVRLPLGAVARQLDQGGVHLEGVDVVVEGRRAAPGDDGEVYSELVGPLALRSHRRVRLLLRFDLSRLSLSGHAVGPAPDVAPVGPAGGGLEHVVTVATERLRRAIVHHGLPCRVLGAAELAEYYLAAEADSETVAVPEDGAGNVSDVGLVLRRGADPRATVDALAAVPSAGVTEVLRLRRVDGRDDVVDVVHTVGLTGALCRDLPPVVADGCVPLRSGVLPVPGEEVSEEVTGHLGRRRIADLDALAPPAHGAGQILGATRSGAAAALQLAGPHLRTVHLTARAVVCRQVVFRTVAAGYRVAVVTDVPERWRPLTAIGDESRYRIVDPESSDPGAPVDAVVWDVARPLTEGRIDAFAGPGGPDVTPPTVIRVDADWDANGAAPPTADGAPDLVLDGRIDGWISVEPRSGEAFQVSLVAGPGEAAFIGR